MEVQSIHKIPQQKKLERIFLRIFNVNYMGFWYGYSTSVIWAFDNIENKHTLCCGEDCMKKFCESLREHMKNIIDFEKKKMLPLTKEELKSHQDAKVCYICGKRFLNNFVNKNYRKVRDHYHFTGKCRGAAHSMCNLRFNMPNGIPLVFYNTSN